MLVLAEQNRTFGYAVAASLALHALALAAQLPAKRQTAEPPLEPPLVAHLVELPAPAPPVAAKEEPAKPRPQPPRPKPVVKAAKPKPAPAPRPSTPIAAAPPAPAPAPPPVIEEPPIPEGVDHGSPELAPLAPPPTLAAVAPPAPAPDPAAELARFRQELVDMAVRYKRYPRMALDNGWTGDVVVRIDVSAGGAVTAVQVKTSSGYSVLDEQALEMFRRAAPTVQVPPALHGKDFSVEVRAIYNLQDRPG